MKKALEAGIEALKDEYESGVFLKSDTVNHVLKIMLPRIIKSYEAMISALDDEPEKPTIDPEIKRVYDHWKKNDGIVVIERAFEREMWNCIKAHCEGGE